MSESIKFSVILAASKERLSSERWSASCVILLSVAIITSSFPNLCEFLES